MLNKINEIRKTIRENKYTEFLYLIAVASYSFLMCYSSSEIIELPYLLRLSLYLISLVFALPKVVSQQYTKNELLFCISMCIFTGIYAIANNTIMYFIIPSLLIGAKNSNMKTIAKIILIVLISFIIIHTISYTIDYSINIHPLNTILHFNRSFYINNMHCYNHNRYAARWVCSFICYLYITDRNKNRIVKFIVLSLITIFVYALCQSRACFIIMIGLCAFIALENYNFFKYATKIFKYFSFVFSLFYSIVIQYLDMNTSFAKFLNYLTTLRVEYAINNRNIYGARFFSIVTNDMGSAAIDMLVQDYIIKYGYFFLIVLIIYIIYLLYVNKNDIFIEYTMSLMFIMSLSQRTPRHITLTFLPLLIMHNYFINNDQKSKYII